MGRTSDRSRFTLIDTETRIAAQSYGCMYMQADPIRAVDVKGLYTKPYFHITEEGRQVFTGFGVKEPPRLVKRMLARHKVTSDQITLITHQASSRLLEAWQKAIQPGQYLQSLEKFANTTVANIPLNLAYFYDQIEKDYLVLLGLGAQIQANGVLLQRRRE